MTNYSIMPYLSNNIIDQIWLKATAVDGFNSDKWRKDFTGAWIQCDARGHVMPGDRFL